MPPWAAAKGQAIICRYSRTYFIDTSDYDYIVSLNDKELVQLTYERPSAGLFNFITVEYEDESGPNALHHAGR